MTEQQQRLISLQSKELSRVFSSTTIQKHQFFSTQSSLWSNSHLYMTTEKTVALTRQTFAGKVISLLFNMLSRLVLVKSLSHVRLFATPWIVAYQALRSLSVHGIFQARVLEWVAISFSRGSSQPRDWTRVSRTAGRRFTIWAPREVLIYWVCCIKWNTVLQLALPGSFCFLKCGH